MSINLVWKGKTACIVEKGRNMPEIYHGSIGTITDGEMIEYRRLLAEIPQEHRVRYAKTNFNFTSERYKGLPSHKKPCDDKRTVPLGKKKRAAKKPKKETKTIVRRYIPQQVSSISHTLKMMEREKIRKELSKSKIQKRGLDVSRYSTTSQKRDAIDRRITKIKTDRVFARSVIKQKENIVTASKETQKNINKEKEYWTYVYDNTKKAIHILREQRADLRK